MYKFLRTMGLLFSIVFSSSMSFSMDPHPASDVQPTVNVTKSCDFINLTTDTVYVALFKPELALGACRESSDFSGKILCEIPVAFGEVEHIDFSENIRFFTIYSRDGFKIIITPLIYHVDSLISGSRYKIYWNVTKFVFTSPRAFKQEGAFVIQA